MENNGNIIFNKKLNKQSLPYIGSFDWLRGIATLFVLLIHAVGTLFKGAWIALDLFFVLSGFLITSLLQNEYLASGTISFAKFYTRRALKIFPPVIICVVIANIFWSFSPLAPGADRTLATSGALFYFSNFLHVNVMGNMHHLWSLSVEEHFYFLWPLLILFFISRISLRKRMVVLVTLIFITGVVRIIIFNWHFSNNFFILDAYRCTFSRVDGILLGALLSILLKNKSVDLRTENKSKVTFILSLFFFAFIVILFSVAETDFYWNNGGFIITNLLCTFTIWIALKEPNHFFFSSKILRWVGKRSYSIYLYHIPIFLALENFRHPHNFIIVTFFRIGLSIGAAALSYKYIEQPILKGKRVRINLSKAGSNPLALAKLKSGKEYILKQFEK